MIITDQQISDYISSLKERECSENTISKYNRDLSNFRKYIETAELTKELIVLYKKQLVERYSSASVNSMLAPLNGLLDFIGMPQLKVKPIKIQRTQFRNESRNITRDEYTRLVKAAEASSPRLALIIQTICSTGIRVSELYYITADAVMRGFADIHNKGKSRRIFLPDKLRELLKKYMNKEKRLAGAVFVTRSGKPVDRSNIWHAMKSVCKKANVNAGKVFPHNLRHLFAQQHYEKFHDLSRLCDILGHSNVSTTRIYTADCGLEHIRQLNSMELILDLPHNADYVVNHQRIL